MKCAGHLIKFQLGSTFPLFYHITKKLLLSVSGGYDGKCFKTQCAAHANSLRNRKCEVDTRFIKNTCQETYPNQKSFQSTMLQASVLLSLFLFLFRLGWKILLILPFSQHKNI